MSVYYNEFDPFAAAWLKALISAGVLPAGEVDNRSIIDVQTSDLKGFTQHHFFAGIGGWAHALQLAGWPEDKPVWTGSCPCQPFSVAGSQKGILDDRHLWPAWFRLVREFQPSTIFGEQVAAAIAKGWLDGVRDDLESEGYAFASAVLPACSVNAPQNRYRTFFVGDPQHNGLSAKPERRSNGQNVPRPEERPHVTKQSAGAGTAQHVADSELSGLHWREDAEREIVDGHFGRGDTSSYVWIECPDGKARPVKPGLQLVAHGVSNRVGKLRGYGNAIVPQVAAEFIKAYMSI